MADKQSRELELLVAKIQQRLAPEAEVIHNAKMAGRLSKRNRQIDVLVRQRIGQYEMSIVLECKDHARPIDVKGVEEFHGLLEDVGAHKGALVCPRGFSKAAKERARGLQVDLYSPVDTAPHKWRAKVSAPAICDFREAMISFGVSMSSPVPFTLPHQFWSKNHVITPDGRDLGTPMEQALTRWNGGDFPSDPGEHRGIEVFAGEKTKMDNGHGQLVEVELRIDLLVNQGLFFGQIPFAHLSGFKDELTGNVITNAFTLGILDPHEVAQTWTPIANEAEAPITPLLVLTGLIGYG
jgi:hypothetical protein